MKKLLTILGVILMFISLSACSKENKSNETIENETEVEIYDISGRWISKHDENADFSILNFNEDKTGSVTDTPYGIGLAFNYEIDGTDIMTHMGSYDDNTEMTYLSDSDEISYDDVIYERLDEESEKIVGVWTTDFSGPNDEYTILIFDNDGSGKLINMPLEIGLAFRYEIDGNDIMTHMASEDDNSPMTYLQDSDQISYDDVIYSRTF